MRAGWWEEMRVVEHLWTLIGKGPIPVAIAIECLQPERVTPIVTTPTAVEQLRRAFTWVNWNEPVVIDGFDPVAAADQLRVANLAPGDLFWGPGTTPMNIEVVNRWTLEQATTWDRKDHRRWYLPARGGELLPDVGKEVQVSAALAAAVGQSLDVLCTLDGLCSLSQLPVGTTVTTSRHEQVPTPSPFTVADLARHVADLVALQPAQFRGIRAATSAGGRRGDLLEAVVFHLVLEILNSEHRARRVVAPTTVSLNVKASDLGLQVTELDVVIQSGPLLTNISCGATQQTVFKTKFMEAKERAQQIGGSESRAHLVCHRTSTTRGGAVPRRGDTLAEAAADRSRLSVSERYGTSGARFGMCRLDELFAGRSARQVEAVLADPVAHEASIPGLGEFVAFVRNSVYR